MKWFYDLQAKHRILITIASWVPFALFAVISGGNVPDGLLIVDVLFIALGVVFTVFAVRAHKKEHPAAEKKPKEVKEETPSFDSSNAEIERDFYTKVVGVTFKNKDGSDRQKILSKCKNGDDIIFKPTPSKEYPDAIGVFTPDGKQLGNVNAELALELKNKYPMHFMKVKVANITGGTDGLSYGCNLHIVIYKK